MSEELRLVEVEAEQAVEAEEAVQGVEARCRACLQREGELHMFTPTARGDPAPAAKLRAVAPLQIWENDGLPDKLCKLCVGNLEHAYSFQQQCMESDSNLRKMFIKKYKEIKCEYEPPEHESKAFKKEIKKEPIDNSNNLSCLLQKIGLSGEINIRTVTTNEDTNTRNDQQNKKKKSNKHRNNNDRLKLKTNRHKGSRVKRIMITNDTGREKSALINFDDSADLDDAFDRASSVDSDINLDKIKNISRKNVQRKIKVKKNKLPKDVKKLAPKNDALDNELYDLFQTDDKNEPYECKFCDNIILYTYKEQFEHVTMHRNERSECDVCKKTLKGRDRIQRHKGVHDKKMFPCDYCGKIFSRHYLRNHINIVHKHTSTECTICHKVLTSEMTYKRHMNTVHKNRKLYECVICSKKVRYMNRHMLSHSGEKPFECKVCGGAFTIKKSLVEHERLHTGVTPYECPVCGKGFAQRSNMKSHFVHNHRRHNLAEEERRVKELKERS